MASPKVNGTEDHSLPVPMRPRRERKPSSPMNPAFMTSAPGKVIVYGEHAVVHGKAAIAAAISLRSYLLVETLSKSKRTVSLRFSDIGLDHTWEIDSLPWSIFADPDHKKMYYDRVTSLDSHLIGAIQPHLASVSPDAPPEIRKQHQGAATTFLYLFLSLGNQSFPGSIYALRSTIPIGAGLGSSASISVCLSAALLLQIRTLAGPHQDQPPDEATLQLERINHWAFVGEMCLHGNPSGVDNTVSVGGKAVLFKRTNYNKPPTVTHLRTFPELPLLLVNTKQTRSTAKEVAKVGALKEKLPEVTELILNAIDRVTESAHELLASTNFDDKDPHAAQKLGALMNINHGLLVSLGVSHPKLDRVRELVDAVGIGWTKLTGAGGGGSAIALLKPDTEVEKLRDLEARIEKEGFERFETTLGGDGVGVLFPAIVKHDSAEEGGDEIDMEKFLQAEGEAGVEELVSAGGNKEGWKFWRAAG
ncbi:Mevalonate kinase [Lecanora helva]